MQYTVYTQYIHWPQWKIQRVFIVCWMANFMWLASPENSRSDNDWLISTCDRLNRWSGVGYHTWPEDSEGFTWFAGNFLQVRISEQTISVKMKLLYQCMDICQLLQVILIYYTGKFGIERVNCSHPTYAMIVVVYFTILIRVSVQLNI